ncbi:MAG: DNA polymerase III subunit delta' [Armatimonadetes bacterium]|nr:DNA polymerase III subunit delta' [Armatimonadota bacterium]
MPFVEVVGQDHAILLLREAMRADRVAHAYAFIGPSGVGRTAVALAFAQLLNCERRGTMEACGACGPCRKIREGIHPDVRVIPGEEGKAIGIDEVRALKHDAVFAPYEGRWKVYILRDAETMSPPAANSLLKLLEEPPERVVLILIAESTGSLLPTVVSRCQLVRFTPARTAQVEQALVDRHGIPPERARLLATLAGGRMGQALRWAASPEVLEARDEILDLIARLDDADPAACLEAADALSRRKEDLDRLLDVIYLWFRDAVIWQETQDPEMIVNVDRRHQLAEAAARLSSAELRRRMDAVEAARAAIRRNASARLALETFFLTLADVPEGEGASWHVLPFR